MSWRERLDYDGGPNDIGEDENGVLWLPAVGHPGLWDRRFNPWNPLHWSYYWRARRTGRVAWIVTDDGGAS